MKARVKATGEIIEVHKSAGVLDENTETIYPWYEVETLTPYSDNYWEKLKHQYAGMAMNALLLTNNIRNGDLEGMRECNTNAMAIAHALVEKLKESKV